MPCRHSAEPRVRCSRFCSSDCVAAPSRRFSLRCGARWHDGVRAMIVLVAVELPMVLPEPPDYERADCDLQYIDDDQHDDFRAARMTAHVAQQNRDIRPRDVDRQANSEVVTQLDAG